MKNYFGPEHIVAFALFLITVAVNVSMPLFRVYAQEAGMGNGQTALVLASYILGMLPCYVLFGGLSDKIGRKPVMILSVFCALASTLIITIFVNVYALIFARLFQGIALGLSMGAGTAYITEILQKEENAATKAANIASSATAFGFSGGALATTLLLLWHFTTCPMSYYVLIVLTVIGLLLMIKLPNIKPIGGKTLRLPYFPKGSGPINISIGICWAATGIVIAIIPSQLAKLELTAYSGFCLVLINWTGAFLQRFIRQNDAIKLLLIGFVLIPLGFGIVVWGCYLEILTVILLGTAIIGSAAYGFSYVGGLAEIANLGGEQKARAISGYMMVGYIGFGIPAIFLGFLSDQIGIVNTLFIFECLIIVLSTYLFLQLKKSYPKTNRAV